MKKRSRFVFPALVLVALALAFSGAALAQSKDSSKKKKDNDYLFSFGQNDKTKEEAESEPAFNQYDPKYRPRPQVSCACPKSLLSALDLGLSVIPGPNTADGYFVLRFWIPASVTGCLEKKDAKVEIAQHGPALKIKLNGEKITTDNHTVRYAHYTCDPVSAHSSTEITLGRDQLIKDGVKEISVAYGEDLTLGTYTLALSPSKLEIARKLFMPNPPEVDEPDKLVFWFYPKDTYVLYAPDFDTKDKETAKRLRVFAEGKGLSPLESVLPGFKPTYYNRGKIYVVDTRGVYRDRTSEKSPTLDLGFAESTETYYAAGGPQERSVKKVVRLKRPGLDE